jgi:dTDP-glucose pyrophosphorylase
MAKEITQQAVKRLTKNIKQEVTMINPKLTEFFLAAEDTIKDAMIKFDSATIKLILIVSKDYVLQGTITDGDIRRAILKKLPIDTPLKLVMNESPKTLTASGNHASAKKLMNLYGIPAIPQLDNKKRVYNLLGIDTTAHKRDNAVLIMAGGFGKRLKPLTDNCPKPMLKVGGKPILENIIEQFITSGFYNFYISTHYLNEQIENYFGDGSDFGVNINYIRESSPLGTAGCLSLLPDSVKDKSIIMMNGDLLTQINFENLLAYHDNEQSDISVAVREYKVQIPFGVIEHDSSNITEITEKPEKNYFINAGIYCISPNILKSIKPNIAFDMPELISKSIKGNMSTKMFPVHEYWLDIGRMNDFEQAQSDILKFRQTA